MEKKIVAIFFLLAIFSYGIAEEMQINNVFLGEQIKIDANYEGLGIDANTSCQFLFYETNSGFLADRATDEYSLDNNHVYSVDHTINEPPFFRDQNYTVKTICAGIERDGNFTLGNRRTIGYGLQKETEYLFKSANLDIIAILISVGLMLFVFFAIIFWFYKMKVKM